MIQAVWHVMLQLSPWLLLGAIVAAILHGVLPDGLIRRQFRGPKGVVKAVAFGVPLPLCSCGVIPAALGLKKDGASDGASVGFLISTPQTGVDSVMVSAAFLGWPFALFKVASAAVMGLVGGLLADRVGNQIVATEASEPEKATTTRQALAGMVDHGLQVIQSVWVWLVFGVVVSAAIETYVPSSVWTGLSAYGGLVTFGAVLGVSLPLYVCATASVPIAAALVAGGLPHGAALVFLMAGPASNLATIGAVLRGFGARVLFVYLTTIIVGSIGAGMLFDSVLAGSTATSSHHGEHGSWWAVGSAAVLSGMLVTFAVADARRWIRQRTASSPSATMIIGVEGMTCGGCVRKLEAALGEIDNLDFVAVQLEPGEVRASGQIDRDQILGAIRACGYRPVDADSTSEPPAKA